MAVRKKTLTISDYKKENEILRKELDKLHKSYSCHICGDFKSKLGFYASSDLLSKTKLTPICKDCARKIALNVDDKGMEHNPTKESVIKALLYLNKPFVGSVWEKACSEAESSTSSAKLTNAWGNYMRTISGKTYNGLTFQNSDFFVDKEEQKALTNDDIEQIDIGDREQMMKDRSYVISLLHYDPFAEEPIASQPLLYSQLVGFLDSSEDANDDMLRISSSVSIVRGFEQLKRIDDTLARLMMSSGGVERNAGAIKTLQDSKDRITRNIATHAEQSCISLKHSKNAKKGENTWTGKVKKVKDINLREGEVNGFDIWTAKGMQQVMEMSDASIMKQLALDESEWSDMVAEQRKKIRQLDEDMKSYQEIARILLRENIDLRDTLAEKGLLDEESIVNLDQLYSCFSDRSDE